MNKQQWKRYHRRMRIARKIAAKAMPGVYRDLVLYGVARVEISSDGSIRNVDPSELN